MKQTEVLAVLAGLAAVAGSAATAGLAGLAGWFGWLGLLGLSRWKARWESENLFWGLALESFFPTAAKGSPGRPVVQWGDDLIRLSAERFPRRPWFHVAANPAE